MTIEIRDIELVNSGAFIAQAINGFEATGSADAATLLRAFFLGAMVALSGRQGDYSGSSALDLTEFPAAVRRDVRVLATYLREKAEAAGWTDAAGMFGRMAAAVASDEASRAELERIWGE